MNLRVPGLVSIIMPVYQGERFVASAIESVLRQTYAGTRLPSVKKKGRPAPGGLSWLKDSVEFWQAAYALRLRRRPLSPASATPNSRRLDGSGTATAVAVMRKAPPS